MSTQVNVRFDDQTLRIVRKVTRARGEDVSDLIRRAVKAELARLSLLSDFEKKALGIVGQSPTAHGEAAIHDH